MLQYFVFEKNKLSKRTTIAQIRKQKQKLRMVSVLGI